MRILFASADNSHDINGWSGLPYFMRCALQRQGIEVVPFHEFNVRMPAITRLRNTYIRIVERRIHNVQLEPAVLSPFANLIREAFDRYKCDVIFSPLTGTPVTAFVDPSIPVVSYGDATKYDWISTYNRREDISRRSWKVIDRVDSEIMMRHRAIVFASDWARRGAAERHPEAIGRLHVVPFGANIMEPPSRQAVESRLERLPTDRLNLLFLGKEWERKGGPDAVRLAQALHAQGIPVKLRIVGCYPPREVCACPFVEVVGFLDKSQPTDLDRYCQVMFDTHFLTMFPQAEAYGLVFCEASAFGVPVIATSVGGIPTIVSDGINGRTFTEPLNLGDICGFIVSSYTGRYKYRELSASSRRCYESRLNWDVAGRVLQRIIQQAVSGLDLG